MFDEACNLGYNSDGNIGPINDTLEEEEEPDVYE